MVMFCRACVLGTALLVSIVASAGASRLGTSALPSPDSLILAARDVPGTSLTFNGFVPGQTAPQYARMFVPNRRGVPLVEAVLIMHPDAARAAAVVTGLNTLAQTDAGRQKLAVAALNGIRSAIENPVLRAKLGISGTPTVSKVTVGAPSHPTADVTILPHTVVLSGRSYFLAIAYVQVDRAIDAIELFGTNRTPPTSKLAGLIAKARSRMRAGFTVANTGPPTISGVATIGQTLTSDSGNWSGGATDFSYSWQRCAADGTACTPIDGATNSTYTLTSTDTGSTIRLTVSAANTVGHADATSTQTIAVD